MKKSLSLIFASLLLSITSFALPATVETFETVSEDISCEQIVSDSADTTLSADVSGSLLTGEAQTQGTFVSSNSSQWNDNNNTNHFFIAYDGINDVYVGYKLSEPTVITNAVLYPDERGGNNASGRLIGATIEASVNGTDWCVLTTVTDSYKTDLQNKLPISFSFKDNTPYNYIRLYARAGRLADANGYFCLSEASFYGNSQVEEKLVSDKLLESSRHADFTANWSDGSYAGTSGTNRVFFYNGYGGNAVDAYAGLDFGINTVKPTKAVIIPSADASNSYNRLNNSVIQGFTDGEWKTITVPDFSLYKSELNAGGCPEIVIELPSSHEEYTALRLFRAYQKNYDYLCFIDLAFYGYINGETTRLTGNEIYSHSEDGKYYLETVPSNVFDGNTSTFFMANTTGENGTTDIWAGYDFGEGNAAKLSFVRYYGVDRANTESRVAGQIFQGSSDGESWTNLKTIVTGTRGTYVTLMIYDSTPYRYVRLLDKNGINDSFFCQSEIEFYGTYASKYTLTLDSTSVCQTKYDSIAVLEGQTVDLSEFIPTAENYTFDGWYDSNGSKYEGSVTLNGDLSLTAQWIYTGIAPLSYNKNSIRLNNPSGIRFKSAVTNTIKADAKTTEYGYIVTRQTLLGGKTAYELIFDSDIRYVQGVSYGIDPDTDKKVDRIYDIDSVLTYFTAVIYGIKETPEAYSENIIVRPYIVYDGEVIYGEPMSRSLLNTAIAIRDSGYKDLSDYDKTKIQDILTLCGESI